MIKNQYQTKFINISTLSTNNLGLI